MTRPARVSTYLSSGEEFVDLVDGSRIRVTSQKTEALLAEAANAGSATSRFVNAVADDDILRTFFMLSSEQKLDLNEKFPASESFPVIMSPDYDIFRRLEESYRKEEADVKDRKEKTMNEMKEINQSTFYGMVQTLFKDAGVIKARTSRPPEWKRAIDLAIERNEDEAGVIVSGFLSKVASMLPEFNLYNKMVSFLSTTQDARSNATALNYTVQLPDECERLFAAVNALAATNTVKIDSESLCLDCYFKYKDEPYSSVVNNVKDLELAASCPRCKDRGVFHKIVVHYPRGLHRLIMPETNWLQELILGYKLSDVQGVARVFVHKKISVVKPGRAPLPSVECDIALITEDRRLILIEVTKQSDQSNLFKEAGGKIRNLNDKQIPYFSFGYVTGSSFSDRFVALEEGKKALVFFVKHIAKIEDFVRLNLVKPPDDKGPNPA